MQQASTPNALVSNQLSATAKITQKELKQKIMQKSIAEKKIIATFAVY